MKFYLAPMEGLTGFVFRNAYQKHFGDIDTYFTPFINNKKMNYKEIKDILPEHNKGMHVVPQILTNRAEDFLAIAKELGNYGYESVNLNLGCPSGTVVTKHRGAGFLAVPEELDHFLEEIFADCPLRISVKTRIGINDAGEWERILSIYEKYPMEELIIHPRVMYRQMLTGNKAFKELFRALEAGETPILFHCTAGKDRTGVAAMLILLALGASDETICADYARTNLCRAAEIEKAMADHAAEIAADPAQRMRWQTSAGVDPETAPFVLRTIRQDYGSAESYLEAEYGLTPARLMRLRRMYLE